MVMNPQAIGRLGLMDRIVRRVAVDRDSDCWIWQGSLTYGYGHISISARTYLAHRIAYEAFVGRIPAGRQIDHLCRNRRCCNPRHLDVVTCRENLLRGKTHAAKNAAKTHCPNGHPYSGDNLRTFNGGRHRHCRQCHNEAQLRYSARRKAAA